LTFPGVVPADEAVGRLVASAGLHVERVIPHGTDRARWLLVGHHSRAEVDAAVQRLAATHRVEALAIRRI